MDMITCDHVLFCFPSYLLPQFPSNGVFLLLYTIIPPFKILPTRQISPVYGIHPFIDRCHRRRNKRKKEKGHRGISSLCPYSCFLGRTLLGRLRGPPSRDIPHLNTAGMETQCPCCGKTQKHGRRKGINQVMEERRSMCLKWCMQRNAGK